MTLSTPMIWIILPLVVAAVCVVLNKRRVFGIILISVTAFGLALLAAFFPEEMVLTIGPLGLAFDESLSILGRRITLAYEMLPFIAFIFGMLGLWGLSSNYRVYPTLSGQLG
jgi:hypothetical protein